MRPPGAGAGKRPSEEHRAYRARAPPQRFVHERLATACRESVLSHLFPVGNASFRDRNAEGAGGWRRRAEELRTRGGVGVPGEHLQHDSRRGAEQRRTAVQRTEDVISAAGGDVRAACEGIVRTLWPVAATARGDGTASIHAAAGPSPPGPNPSARNAFRSCASDRDPKGEDPRAVSRETVGSRLVAGD
jgi:hypothetical protein